MSYDLVYDIFFIFGSVQFDNQCRKVLKWAEMAGNLHWRLYQLIRKKFRKGTEITSEIAQINFS